MVKRKWIIGTSAVLLVLLLLASYMAVAAETSNQEDPLVALSYLTDVLAPETIEKVNAAIEKRANEMDTLMKNTLTEYTTTIEARIAEFEARNENIATDPDFVSAVTNSVLAKIGNSGNSSGSITGSGWSLVSVNKGETFKFKVGGMMLLRIGSATCYTPSSPGLIDTTSGTELDGGGDLQKNHTYMVTIDDRGFTATTDCKIMVFGEYTVS